MDVFLDSDLTAPLASPLRRIAVSEPLRATTADLLPVEAMRLQRCGVQFVSVRRQQVLRIGEHVLLDVLHDHGIRISSLGFAGGFTGTFGNSYDDVCVDTTRAIDLACQLGAAGVVVIPGPQGLHTYRHAERNIRDGLAACVGHAHDFDVRLYVPTDSVLPGQDDCFRPRRCPLEWVHEFGSSRIQPMIVIRGRRNYLRLPRDWRYSLITGGCLRLCHRSADYAANALLLRRILRLLTRRFTAFRDLDRNAK